MRKIKKAIEEIKDLRSVLFRFQRTILRPASREAISSSLSRFLPHTPNFELGSESEATVQNMKRDGYSILHGLLEPQQIDEMRKYFSNKLAADPYRPESGLFLPEVDPPKTCHVAFYPASVVVEAPHAMALANHPSILNAVEELLGCKPTISYMAAWWSLAGAQQPEQAELFHRDVDDWRFIKLFVYLTDVDQESGPHIFVKSSHQEPKLLRIRRYRDDEVEASFGQHRLVQFCGEAGTAFLENTYGIHRGLRPTKKDRLLFQVVYSMFPIPYGPKQPLTMDKYTGETVDEYTNRIYIKRPH